MINNRNHNGSLNLTIRTLAAIALCAMTFASATTAGAQVGGPLQAQIVTATPGTLTVTLADANGVPLETVAPADVVVREDGGPAITPSRVERFADPDARLSLLLAIDVSGSMAGKPLADAKTAAKQLLSKLGPNDRAAVIVFSDKIRLDDPFPQLEPARERDFSLDKVGLAAFVDAAEAKGNTPLYDAAVKAVRLAERESGTRRAVILLTDGRDEVLGGATGSGSEIYNDDSGIIAAVRARVPVFTIGLGNLRDKPYLTRLASLTGGSYQDAPDSAQLSAQFQTVLERMKTRTRVSYSSSLPEDGKTHRVSISVKKGESTATAEFEVATKVGQATPMPPTATPVPPTAAIAPTADKVAIAVATLAPTPTPDVKGQQDFPILPVAGAAILVLAVGGYLIARASRPKPVAMVACMRCGKMLSPDVKVCPYCNTRQP
jgi:Mg-chelatase subunit ChlD